MVGWPAVLITSDHADLADDVRRIFQDLERHGGRPWTAATGQCTPPLDVLETDETVEIAVDLPGVDAAQVRIVLKGGLVLVAGEKIPAPPSAPGSGDYHLLERGFGRFARAVRVVPPFDGSRARAYFSAGELRIVLPKIHDRRGQARTLSIGPDPAVAQS
jgi:HSP20 family protein